MSGTLPSTPHPSRVNFESRFKTQVSRAQSGKRFTRKYGGHVWILQLEYARLTRDEFNTMYSFLLSQHGRAEIFDVVVEDKATPQGSISGSPTVKTVDNDNQITLQNLAISETGVLKPGDILTFGSSTKVYWVTSQMDSDGTGEGQVTFIPALIAQPSNGDAVGYQNVPFKVSLSSDNLKATKYAGQYYGGISIDLEEHY